MLYEGLQKRLLRSKDLQWIDIALVTYDWHLFNVDDEDGKSLARIINYHGDFRWTTINGGKGKDKTFELAKLVIESSFADLGLHGFKWKYVDKEKHSDNPVKG